MARASAKISLSMPGVAGSSTPLAGLATLWQQPEDSGVTVEPQQQQQQQQQPQQLDGQPQQSEEGSGVPMKRARKGTAGTFKGRRPPKDPAKLAVFEAQRDAHIKQKEEEARQKRDEDAPKKGPSHKQIEYQESMRTQLQGNNSPGAFQSAVQQYRTMVLKRPAASDAHDQPTSEKEQGSRMTCTPNAKRKQSGEATTTPEKGVPPPSSSASSGTSK